MTKTSLIKESIELGACMVSEGYSPLSARQEAWWQAGRHGAESLHSDSQAEGEGQRETERG